MDTLVKLLSAEQLPMRPTLRGQGWEVELDRYIKNLHEYLQKQYTRFSGVNIQEALNNGGSGLFTKVWTKTYKFVGTDNPLIVTIDNTRDWRTYAFLATARIAITFSNLLDPDSVVEDSDYIADHRVGDYTPILGFVAGTFIGSLELDASGFLTLVLDAGGVHEEFFISVTVGAYGQLSETQGDYVLIGDGL